MGYTTLISAGQLAEILDDPDTVVLDARFTLDDEGWGQRVYPEGHIPGAQQADLALHMAGPIIPGVTGRRPFPDPDDFARRLGEWGIDERTQVVAYDAEGGLMAASRLWLMLRWLGHDRVAVLDGGPAGLAGGRRRARHAASSPRAPRTFIARRAAGTARRGRRGRRGTRRVRGPACSTPAGPRATTAAASTTIRCAATSPARDWPTVPRR